MIKKATDFRFLTHQLDCVTFHAGDVIIDEESSNSVAYIVRSGHVEIRHGSQVLEHVELGSIIGEMALIDPSECSASAVATNDVELIALDQRAFLTLIGEQPGFALKVLRLMSHRLQRTRERVHH